MPTIQADGAFIDLRGRERGFSWTKPFTCEISFPVPWRGKLPSSLHERQAQLCLEILGKAVKCCQLSIPMKSTPLIHIYKNRSIYLHIYIRMHCNQTSHPPLHRSPLRVGNNLDIFHDNKKFCLLSDANLLQTLLTISKPFWYLKYIPATVNYPQISPANVCIYGNLSFCFFFLPILVSQGPNSCAVFW